MSIQCEFFEKCGFLHEYEGNNEVVTQAWMHLYCEDKAKSEDCERKKAYKKGESLSDKMAPTGSVLP
jgi:hypothetical protein